MFRKGKAPRNLSALLFGAAVVALGTYFMMPHSKQHQKAIKAGAKVAKPDKALGRLDIRNPSAQRVTIRLSGAKSVSFFLPPADSVTLDLSPGRYQLHCAPPSGAEQPCAGPLDLKRGEARKIVLNLAINATSQPASQP